MTTDNDVDGGETTQDRKATSEDQNDTKAENAEDKGKLIFF